MFYEGKVEAERICTSSMLEKVVATSDDRDSYNEFPSDWDFALIDTRPREEYEAGHINGAVNMPRDGAFLENILPDDKDKQLIFYGTECYDWMYEAKEAGYENLYLYDADIEGWKAGADYLTTTPQYVSELIAEESISNKDKPHYILIDTRGFGMYFESHIPTAQSMDHTNFEDKYLDYLPADKETEIITYCGGFF